MIVLDGLGPEFASGQNPIFGPRSIFALILSKMLKNTRVE